MSETVALKWSELKALMETMEKDMSRNAKGNVSAGIRTRKGLRMVKKAANELLKATLEHDKSMTEVRKTKRETKKVETSTDVSTATE
jgi:hypothetical protein